MSESRDHIDLVAITVEYIKTIIEPNMYAFVQYDSADSKRPTKIIGNYIPDVFFWHKNLLIIGEAKTAKDFERKHSKDQYLAYMSECMKFYGKAILVISVPWQLVPTTKNYFRRMKKDMHANVQVVVVNDIGRAFEI